MKLNYFGEDLKVKYSGDSYKDFISQLGGRRFGIDLRKNTCGNVLLFEIGTGDILEIPLFLGGEDTVYNLEKGKNVEHEKKKILIE